MKIAETCVKYPIFTVMLISFLVTLGVFSYRGLAVDLFPKADPATVNVEVRLPGATPEEVVTGVVLPLEGLPKLPVRLCWSATSKARLRTFAKKLPGPSTGCRVTLFLQSLPSRIHSPIRS
jgi:hypothetical protein